jgi:hypothetical protein
MSQFLEEMDEAEFLVNLSEFIEYYGDYISLDIINEILVDRIFTIKESGTND